MDPFKLKNDILVALDAEIVALSDKVARGKCSDMSEYSRDCGAIGGYVKAKDLVRKLFNATSEDGDSLE